MASITWTELRTQKGAQKCAMMIFIDDIYCNVRYLTDLGKKQAEGTGQRLGLIYSKYLQKLDENGNELKTSNIKLVKSTMTRATETANIILKHLPDIEHTSCDLLREGAPCVPDPPSGPNICLHDEKFQTSCFREVDPRPSRFFSRRGQNRS